MSLKMPLLTAAQCQERQINEFEVLQAIYWDSKIEDLRTKQAWNAFQPLEMQISLRPSEGESNTEMYVGIDLYIKCPLNYPAVPPQLELRNHSGIGDHQAKILIDALKKQAEDLVGEVMIHELCSQVRAFLHGHNKPPKESCHAEMMKTIKEKEKAEEDQLIKIQEEKENFEKLQAESIKLELKKKKEELRKEKKRRLDMLDLKRSLELRDERQETPIDITKACQWDDDSDEEDLRISVSELDADIRLQNDFTVLEKLGHGAFGDVIKVQNLLDKRNYAIKRIPLNFNKIKTKKITQEVKLLSRLNHKNVVRYYTSWIETSSRVVQKRSPSESSYLKISPNKQLNSSISDSDDSIDSSHDDYDQESEESGSILFQENSQKNEDDSDDESSSVKSDKSEVSLKTQFLYIQMEFCDKSTLRDCIDQEMYLDKQLVWLLFGEIVEGLVHIHDQGIIHRDLKPVNIFLDSQNHVKIGDFGLATVASKTHELTSQEVTSSSNEFFHNCDESLTSNVGTALYVSPEVMSGKKSYNQKVDLYSLGIIFFEMSYKPLNTSMERCKILGLVRQSSVQFPEDFDSIVQPSQKEILVWLLNHDPANRPFAKELLGSKLFPMLPEERNKVEKTLINVVNNVDAPEYKVLMSKIFSKKITTAVDFSYDYMITKEFNFTSAHEVSLIRQYVVGAIEKILKRHGAVSYDVPTYMPHPQDIYPDSCDEVLFLNKSGTILSAPYDSRVNFARYIGRRNICKAKRFFIGKIYREFSIPELQPKELWECSFDIISSYPNLKLNFDVEVITILQEIFNELPGFSDNEFQLKFNHINFTTAIMNYCCIPKEMHHEIFLVFKEYEDIHHKKSQLMTKFLNLGLKESDIKKFFELTQKEDSFAGISNYLKSLPKIKKSESALISEGTEYFKSLLDLLDTYNSKFQVVFSMKLCSNFHIYSGLSFQVSRRRNKKLDVLASGGTYDSLFNTFRQLDSHDKNHDKKHGVGVSISLDKIISSVRLSQTLKEGKNVNSSVVDMLVSSTRPEKYSKEMHQLTQTLWTLGISCMLFDENDNSMQSFKNFCKDNHIPFLAIVDNQKWFIKIDSSDKDGLLHKEKDFTKFAEFLKKRMLKECFEQTVNIRGVPDHGDNSFSNLEHAKHSSHEVKLVGETGRYKESSKVLSNLANTLEKCRDNYVVILVLETTKDLQKSILCNLKLKDETLFMASMNTVLKECPRHKKYIQKLIEDVVSKRFKNNQEPAIILYFEDDLFRLFI